MVAFTYGLEIAIAFMLVITKVFAFMEMNFDKRSTVVFDMDGTRSPEEQKIIHEYYLPIRALVLLLIATATDMQEFITWLALLGACVCYFWIVFDIMCAVLWLGKPWWYVGEPPPFGINPKMFFIIKGILFALCLFLYVRLTNQHFSQGITTLA
jgi:hypothetical protein